MIVDTISSLRGLLDSITAILPLTQYRIEAENDFIPSFKSAAFVLLTSLEQKHQLVKGKERVIVEMVLTDQSCSCLYTFFRSSEVNLLSGSVFLLHDFQLQSKESKLITNDNTKLLLLLHPLRDGHLLEYSQTISLQSSGIRAFPYLHDKLISFLKWIFTTEHVLLLKWLI